MYVNSYDKVFMEAYDRGVIDMPKELPDVVKKITDDIFEKVLNNLFDYIADDMKRNLDDSIRANAAKVAESMLMNALAGDDKEIRNLFGFNDWYMKNLYIGSHPKQWDLIDAIVKRNPDLFVNEKITQLSGQVAHLQKENARMNTYITEMRERV